MKAKQICFRDVKNGEVFVFASERDEQFRFSGMAKGPWFKTGNRTYRLCSNPEALYYVGSINTGVLPASY